MAKIVLKVSNLIVKLKIDHSIILNNVNFELYSGDVMAIDGLNGSGKSTLLKVIIGETSNYIIESGEIIYYPFSNKNILTFNEKEMLMYHSSIGYVPQKDNYEGLNKLTIEDLIDDSISLSLMSKKEAVELLYCYFNTNEKINLKTIPEKLSGGEQRMVSIFLGLLCRSSTKLMIIDEPLNNLDYNNALRISDLINEIHLNHKNAGIIIITHCKIITCINRQRRMHDGILDNNDSKYECHYCIGKPDCSNFYLKKINI
mgnify:CR=1 FL=1